MREGRAPASGFSDGKIQFGQNFISRSQHPRHVSPISYQEDNSFSYTSTREGSQLIIQDNHKPEFTNCSQYKPSIVEEEPAGTYVLTVNANDRDPPESGGTINYTFVSAPNEKVAFSIDSSTGVITTRHSFDRDEPVREKEVYITVRATDNGKPHLDDVCTIKVTITDVNDNYPVFDKANYVESVPQDLAVGQEVMRISATDIDDGNNSTVVYELSPKNYDDGSYFRMDANSGVIFLNKSINRQPGYKFKLRATASDQGSTPKRTTTDLEVKVVESNKKPPTFTYIPASPIMLFENLSDFTYNIATLTAASNTDEAAPVFELITGRTEQTNKQTTFRLESEGVTAHIRMARHLDYEAISEYSLTIRIQNKHNLGASAPLSIRLIDVNDNIPTFTEVVSGFVLENEPPGTAVMQVRAIDADSSPEHNQVTYKLADNTEYFSIDEYTGNITTRVTFDRESQDVYNVKVIASDNSPSALYSTGEPNRGQQVFKIEIADKNDHPPKFTQDFYYADAISEDANKNSLVAEVKALDNDTASVVSYSIVDGNIDDAFLIEQSTGKIKVANKLDYENIKQYLLKIKAFDGIFEDTCEVRIEIKNVNDNPPVFLPYENKIQIQEELLVPGCITKVEAYDPDIPDREADQNISYFVVKAEQQKLLSIDKNGCLILIKALDRDPPNGFEIWQVLIAAYDNNGPGPDSLTESAEVIISLSDVNDNAPYLNMPQPVVWRENQPPAPITTLLAKDNDSPSNGPPFRYSIDISASSEIKAKFGILDSQLTALVEFDREEKKIYHVPIAIEDSGSPAMTGTSTLMVVIGDENDNAMKEGSSEIFFYKYMDDKQEDVPDTEIGRVFVDDLDDWDLPDKTFNWLNEPHPYFSLNGTTGMITLKSGFSNESYLLDFLVTESALKVASHSVQAKVNVTIKFIPEEAVDKSGSLRLAGISAEDFVATSVTGESKATSLKKFLSKVLNASEENVDVFTILHSPINANHSELDVRFSAHGSPYYNPQKINSILSLHQTELQRELDVEILMININECLQEKKYCKNESCTNFLKKSNTPYPVYTNTSSFVGIRAVVNPFCKCEALAKVCYNGGTLFNDVCECPEGFDGPQCEVMGVGFNGNGWALYPPLGACSDSHISVELQPREKNGLILYGGPFNHHRSSASAQDFISLELQDGYPVLLVDYGSGTSRLAHNHIRLTDGHMHRIDIYLSRSSIELQVDNCKQPPCLSLTTPEGANEFLNINGPLHVGGTAFHNIKLIADHYNWTHAPKNIGFSGCIRNITFNEKPFNLGMPSFAKNHDASCSLGIAGAVSLGIDASFLLALLACLAVLLILLVGVVVHRRKADEMLKDADDIRENIINYEDEGGGEGDMTGYDLTVLRLGYDDVQGNGKLPYSAISPGEVPDICGFLDGKKSSVDNDPETGPFDDVRYYAYEGDGSTTGSLSTLASGTDEGDLNFEYISKFGSRFRKLADMYGDDPSDEEDDNFQHTGSESWC
ncbi:DE-cadherin isoform X2 [Bemisia tabaci]|uniref:DE-cadherin isoform X2 n=1 Tax=Bemisia tabaci TaxID=7038 RepID=UPI003B2868B1